MSNSQEVKSRDREILVIGTYGIDIFYGIIEEMEKYNCIVFTTSEAKITLEYLQNRAFDSIIINLEPDGKGGVAELELLDAISQSPLQQNAVCLGVSAHYPHTLPNDKAEKHLDILAGWLTLPVQAEVLAEHIIELIESPHQLTISEQKKN